MGKKIIILNGSPRKGGNTDTLIEAFVDGAISVGHEVNRFELRDMKINHCIGCHGGKQKNNKNYPCVQNDDMDVIYPAFNEADIVVFASPVYSWFWTACLKNAADRLYAATECLTGNGDYKTPYKETIMLIVGEGDYPQNFDVIIKYYETLTVFLKWKDLGKVLVGGVYNIGDIKSKTSSLEETKKLGASI